MKAKQKSPRLVATMGRTIGPEPGEGTRVQCNMRMPSLVFNNYQGRTLSIRSAFDQLSFEWNINIKN